MDTLPDAGDDDERQLQSIERGRSLSTVAKFLWPILDKGLTKRLHRIKAPTLVAVADGDSIVPPAHGEAFESGIPESRLHIIERAGHLFPLERPDEFAALVTEFLS